MSELELINRINTDHLQRMTKRQIINEYTHACNRAAEVVKNSTPNAEIYKLVDVKIKKMMSDYINPSSDYTGFEIMEMLKDLVMEDLES